MNFSEIIKAEKDEGKEKHVPHIEIDKGHKTGKDIVRVVVGHEVPHPNTVEHHIDWIELYGVRKDNNQVINLGRSACAPVFSNPALSTSIHWFAFPTSDSANASRFMSLLQTSTVAGRYVWVEVNPTDTSGSTFGCGAGDCRRIYGMELR